MKQAAIVVVKAGATTVLGFERAGGEGMAFPGGKVDPNELPEVAASRELLEETGLAITPADLKFFRSVPNGDYLVHVYTYQTSKDFEFTLPPLSPEDGFENEGKPEWVCLGEFLMRGGKYAEWNLSLLEEMGVV